MYSQKQLAFIDPFLMTSSIHCFNELVELTGLPMTYYMPDKFGIDGLKADAFKNSAYFIAGSASNVTESLEWHGLLAQFLISELQANKPVVAVCFGHQLLCQAFGSEIGDFYHSGEKITGLRKIQILEEWGNLKRGDEYLLPVTHKQVVKKLGSELTTLGQGLDHDIVIHKTLPFLSTQAHPEASAYFCSSDIKLKEEDEKAGRADGKKFLNHVFRHFKIL